MTTVADMIAETRRNVVGSLSDEVNVLAADYVPSTDPSVTGPPSGVAPISLTYDPRTLAVGTLLSSGLNTWYIVQVGADGKTCLALPNHDGSHNDPVPAGSRVYIRPRITDFEVFENLASEIASMSSLQGGLFRVGEFVKPVDTTWQTYVVDPEDADFTQILRVRYLHPGSQDTWVDVQSWRVVSSAMNAAGQPTGRSIQVLENVPGGCDLTFTYRAAFKRPTALTQTVTDLGMTESMSDIPPLGAAAAALLTFEGRRNQVASQGDPRRAEEVNTGGNANTARMFRAAQAQRIDDERASLMTLYPYKQRR